MNEIELKNINFFDKACNKLCIKISSAVFNRGNSLKSIYWTLRPNVSPFQTWYDEAVKMFGKKRCSHCSGLGFVDQ